MNGKGQVERYLSSASVNRTLSFLLTDARRLPSKVHDVAICDAPLLRHSFRPVRACYTPLPLDEVKHGMCNMVTNKNEMSAA